MNTPILPTSETVVPGFRVSADELMDRIDAICELAVDGMKITSGIEGAATVKLILREIGLLADSTVADHNTDLHEAWGVPSKAMAADRSTLN